MPRKNLVVAAAFMFCLVSPRHGFAQEADPSHWGVSFSATPAWTLAQQVKELLSDKGEELNIQGREVTIGFVRGSTRGGDAGVSFVRKPWKDGLGSSSSNVDCFSPGTNQSPICLNDREQTFFDHLILNGVEFHWFFAPGFARIKDRVQIGANIGGGIAKVTGSVRTVNDRQQPVFTPAPGGGTMRIVTNHTEETKPANEELLPVFPLLKIELEGAFIASPAVKIKVAGGLNFPGTGVRVMAVYFFGAR